MINKNGKTVEKNNNFRLKFTLIMALTLLVTGLVSYGAFFVTKMQEDNNQITSTCFDQTFSEGTSISLTNALPLSDAAGLETDPYTFTITNNCNVNTMYYIILSTKNTNLPDSKIKFSYNGTNSSIISESATNSLYDVDSGYINSYILTSGLLSLNQSQSFDIRVWLDEATTYASNMSWQGQIKIESVPIF